MKLRENTDSPIHSTFPKRPEGEHSGAHLQVAGTEEPNTYACCPQESIIKNLDLQYLEEKLIAMEKWTLKTAKEAVRRYKNFLILHLRYPQGPLVPAFDIDEVWHNHILFTRKYFDDCQNIFNRYLHHTPSQDSSPEEKQKMQETQILTVELYIREFNEPYLIEFNIDSFWW